MLKQGGELIADLRVKNEDLRMEARKNVEWSISNIEVKDRKWLNC